MTEQCVLTIGSNDYHPHPRKKRPISKIGAAVENLIALVLKLKFGMGATNVDVFVVSHMTRQLNTPNAAEYATKVHILNDIFQKLGQQHPHLLTFVNVTQPVANNPTNLISEDGVHPTHHGYAFIASLVHSAVRNHYLAHKFYPPAAATSFAFTQRSIRPSAANAHSQPKNGPVTTTRPMVVAAAAGTEQNHPLAAPKYGGTAAVMAGGQPKRRRRLIAAACRAAWQRTTVAQLAGGSSSWVRQPSFCLVTDSQRARPSSSPFTTNTKTGLSWVQSHFKPSPQQHENAGGGLSWVQQHAQL
mmetsp:Transcript_36211/g.56672  ORF Transcript_36211/g.56672 Transcript_36211/m.56672 type:complete len:301 (+) Transcript_36211:261-1163(+)